MQSRIYNSLEEAIEGGKQMMEERVIDMSTFLIVAEIYRTEAGFLTVLPDSFSEERSNLGEMLGYVDGRFKPVEEVRAQVRRDYEQEMRDIF